MSIVSRREVDREASATSRPALRIIDAGARRYLRDDAVGDLAGTLAVGVADEAHGADLPAAHPSRPPARSGCRRAAHTGAIGQRDALPRGH
jgi:hypothetical protein